MTKELTAAELAELGLLGYEFVEEESLDIRSDEAALGKGLAAVITLSTLAITGLMSASFTQVPSEIASAAGVQISLCDQNRSIALVEDPGDKPLAVRALPGTAEPYRLEEHLGTVAVDLSKGPVVVINGDALLELETDGARLILRRAALQQFQGRPSVPIGAPLAQWAEDCSDPWMSDELRARSSSQDSWDHAVGAGLHARLLRPNSAEKISEIITAAQTGDVHGLLARARRWAVSLDPDQLSHLASLALDHAARLFDDIDDLDLKMATSDQAWRTKLLKTCIERDDLECVRVILAQAGASNQVDSALDAIDRRGFDFIHALPKVVTFQEPRLRRAILADPEAWWADPASPEYVVA